MEAKKKKTKIMIFGTWDGLHLGHLNMWKQARKLTQNSHVTASVARDKNVLSIKKRLPRLGEKKRMALLKKTKLLDKVVLGGIKNHIPHILKERPDIIALGYDQKNYIKNLKSDLGNRGLNVKIVRLKPYQEKIYKNHLLKGGK